MHELSIAQALVSEVETIRARESAREVTSVTVDIGALSGVDREALEFAFPLAAEGTAMARSALVIREIPAEVTCDGCGRRSAPDLANLCCGACGSGKVRLTAGRDIMIQSVELSVEETK
jgi:hydrogenase nickel incorporation protein HypA/HybF